jgi:wyosine [tRNA(Phe)-imidazoG37] synthetase (radical SAM superfamily)
MQIEREAFYPVEELVAAVHGKVQSAKSSGETIDYLTFVPDGEPTLDSHLVKHISALRDLQIPIAVISNASLLWREDVRIDLMTADWVSLKVDAATASTWHKIDRPHGSLELEGILEGISIFAENYDGFLATETMLIDGVNDDAADLLATAHFLGKVQPSTAYLAIPTRPPAEQWVSPPHETQIHKAFQIFSEHVERVELLLGYEGSAFASTGDAAQDLLSITAVHPMRREAVEQLLENYGADWGLVEALIENEKLVELPFKEHIFYLRRIEKSR